MTPAVLSWKAGGHHEDGAWCAGGLAMVALASAVARPLLLLELRKDARELAPLRGGFSWF